jgi:uncharacterized protein (TIGR04255 family)
MATNIASRKHYANSPVKEAICEFEFSEVRAWDVNLPTRLYDEMRSIYPNAPQAVTAENSAPSERSHGPKVLLTSADGKFQVRCGDNALSIHALRPYPGWEVVSDRIGHALRNFLQAAKPKAIAQINLSYHNRIMVPAQSLLMGDYFTSALRFHTAFRSASSPRRLRFVRPTMAIREASYRSRSRRRPRNAKLPTPSRPKST